MPSSKQLRSSCATNTTLNSSPSLSSSNDSMGDSGSSQTIANSPSFDVSTSSGRQPRKLRKQINTKAFKENYFELDITSSSEVQLLQFRTTDTSRSSTSLPTTTNKKEVHKPPTRSIMNNNNNQHSPRPPQRKQNQIPTQTLKEESNNKKRKTMDHNVPNLQEAPSAFNTTTSISYNNNVNNHSMKIKEPRR
ncbi:hypothetical protein C9374_013108 [Naegleria lovaniensis]|uniref:Uncharacterized protein n=1 Tax=Naegleria lovaniensis TaxID=51637 RepID=A0AA88KBX5_NAELO|nr:uncharacterized protein C9374_013108 [Naegleria lovaniensis]KAG2372828.1 hypothetical protein C9374_013108 [Naegleria lovaniensis]